MILNNGRQNVLLLLAGNVAGKKIVSIVVGSGTAAVSPDDLALTTPVVVPVTQVEYLPAFKLNPATHHSRNSPAIFGGRRGYY